MERRINKKIDTYVTEFKENCRLMALQSGSEDPALHNLIKFIYAYDRLHLEKEDFMKRKRVKNSVNLSERCCAKRASGEQCTRRRKDDTTEFCGTHLKGTPHGVCDLNEDPKPQGHKIEVWAQDIQGIIYYIDNHSNVYQVEDIMQHKSNPKIIAKYVKVGETYIIPEFST
jgi:hypothetical protein